MTEHPTTDEDTANDESKPVVPVADAHTNEVSPEPAPDGAEVQEQFAEKAAYVPESPAEPEPAPEPVAETSTAAPLEPEPVAAPTALTEVAPPKSAKKPRAPRTPKVATTSEEPSPVELEATPETTPTEQLVEPKPENKKKWYAIKVQSGREDTIKAAILRKVAIEGLEESFGQIVIPFEEVIEKKSVRVKDKKTGDYTTQEKKVTRKKKKFQGYLFAELEFTDRILYLFRETSGVGDFLSLRGTPPVPEPMPDHEVQQMLTGVKAGEKKPGKVKLEFEKGDRVRIKEGSFANQEGEVTVISLPKDPTDAPKITVVVTFWGRPLDVELEYWQVAKV